jgi:cysteine synthase A
MSSRLPGYCAFTGLINQQDPRIVKRETGLLGSVSEAIGHTPLVALDRITRGLDGRILAKLEYLNPGFSKKDRPALQIILDAEADGRLQPGQPVVELTSGNMGTGLAIVCGNRGYPFVAVMSKGNSPERARMMAALGAEVVLVDQAPGSVAGQVSGDDLERVEQVTQQLVQARRAFRADQFQLDGNYRSHYLHTGPEAWKQSGGTITAFCDFAGSGGTLAGISRYLKEQDPAIRCYVVEPEGAAVIAGLPIRCKEHPIQGGGYAMDDLKFLRGPELDGAVQVSGEQARLACHRLAREEGIFAGYSSGANLAAALHLLSNELTGQTICILICDSGLKYLSTDLWD